MTQQTPQLTPPQQSASPQRGRAWQRLLVGLGLVAALWAGYLLTGQPVQVVINGRTYGVRTHSRTVEAVIKEMGLALNPEDIVSPQPATPLSPGKVITVQLARPVTIELDGQNRQYLTHRQRLDQLLADERLPGS